MPQTPRGVEGELKMPDNEKIKDWTVMFFFAGDNALSPLIVSQLKAIKDAGFHEDVDVLAHFDSNEVGVPTRIFNVNRERKKGRHFMVGDKGDPFIHDMKSDNIPPEEVDAELGRPSSLSSGLRHEDSATALQALQDFINFCAVKHKAKNYILFLVGHGLVVGHDSFLPDDRPLSAIKLADMRTALEVFNDKIAQHNGTLQLLALHSCAMSAVEVAYELKGLAKYMMGSEGISYIGSWPYRQLLMKLIATVAKSKGASDSDVGPYGENGGAIEVSGPNGLSETAIHKLIDRLFQLSFHNATDFAISGYSLDLCLCNLDEKKLKTLGGFVAPLVTKMIDALKDQSAKGKVIKELILLAHWESQSYWDESYTDLFDFCQCLKKRCLTLLEMLQVFPDDDKTRAMRDDLGGLADACSGVMTQLDSEESPDFAARFKRLIVCSTSSGPQYQYSHGLSVYFPWSLPVDDDPLPRQQQRVDGQSEEEEETAQEVMDRYHDYRFNAEMKEGESWADFLDTYFLMTMRKKRTVEDGKEPDVPLSLTPDPQGTGVVTAVNMASSLSIDKPTPSTGRPCTCTSIKNYPTVSIIVGGKTRFVRAS
jgi:hypothetical protein